jgi:hypothetical protein
MLSISIINYQTSIIADVIVVFILCRVFMVYVVLCAVFHLIVVLFCVMCVVSYCSTTATG